MSADGSPRPAGQLITDYLARLGSAASTLPADRRDELIEEITAHIAEARTQGPGGTSDPLVVRCILDRLGDPTEIVRTAVEADQGFAAAAGVGAPGGPGGAGAGSAWAYPQAAPPGGRAAGAGGLEITTVVFLPR